MKAIFVVKDTEIKAVFVISKNRKKIKCVNVPWFIQSKLVICVCKVTS